MGLNGCGWVLMGAMQYRGTGGHKNKTSREQNGCTGHDLGPMAGEISPDIMFCGVWQKVVRMVADGCRSIPMGEDGCMVKQGSKKKTKTVPNARAGHVCVMRDHVKKRQEVGRDSLGGQRGS